MISSISAVSSQGDISLCCCDLRVIPKKYPITVNPGAITTITIKGDLACSC
ncbi:hypothetical protein [Kamptonema animale]|uniref:hypothetical protein n=1 Tax=Kamptonema animale TaxID=92934 RepID=UPI00232CED41|nr:hypothetical protein [Kamptonema animale]